MIFTIDELKEYFDSLLSDKRFSGCKHKLYIDLNWNYMLQGCIWISEIDQKQAKLLFSVQNSIDRFDTSKILFRYQTNDNEFSFIGFDGMVRLINYLFTNDISKAA